MKNDFNLQEQDECQTFINKVSYERKIKDNVQLLILPASFRTMLLSSYYDMLFSVLSNNERWNIDAKVCGKVTYNSNLSD